MMADDDMIILVIGDDDDEEAKTTENEICSENVQVDDILETAQKHGEFIQVKLESDDKEDSNFIDEFFTNEKTSNLDSLIKQDPYDLSIDFKIEKDDDSLPSEDEREDDVDEFRQVHHKSRAGRIPLLKPSQARSFVEDLRQQYEELKNDEELLINTLEEIMRSMKPPKPPQDYFIMNGDMFECVQCGKLTDSIPAAGRHYQEKHGERYLVCYACGVDFRSTTNLYKHEKRCIAPDAVIVLKARAAFLGRKGRSRPYLSTTKFKTKQQRFPCHLCSAGFITKSNLESHLNLHRGERPYRCHVCPCAYTSHSALSRHTKKHTDIQYICDHCGRSFKIKAALVAHMDIHKPLRKYGCTECERRFAQRSALMLHINRDHRNLPPPCACQICPKRYPRMSLLKAHMKKAHGMSIITRKMFFKSLPTMSDLEVKQSKVIFKYKHEEVFYPDNRDLLNEIIKNNELEHNRTKNNDKSELPDVSDIKTDELRDICDIKTEPCEVDNKITEEENEEIITGDLAENNEGDITLSDLLQYVKQSDLGSNVIYIQNGKVIKMDEHSSGNKLMLKVEATVDGGFLVETLTNNSVNSSCIEN